MNNDLMCSRSVVKAKIFSATYFIGRNKLGITLWDTDNEPFYMIGKAGDRVYHEADDELRKLRKHFFTRFRSTETAPQGVLAIQVRNCGGLKTFRSSFFILLPKAGGNEGWVEKCADVQLVQKYFLVFSKMGRKIKMCSYSCKEYMNLHKMNITQLAHFFITSSISTPCYAQTCTKIFKAAHLSGRNQVGLTPCFGNQLTTEPRQVFSPPQLSTRMALQAALVLRKHVFSCFRTFRS